MARLAAKEKGLFYPTPMEEIELILARLKAERGGRALDPCCGDGKPLQRLGDALGLTTFGIELNERRAEEASARLDLVLSGPRELAAIEGTFGLIFNNPPYDERVDAGRLELEFLTADIKLLQWDGIGVWVLPATVFDDWMVCHTLTSNLRDIEVRRFTDANFEAFNQVVVFGRKDTPLMRSSYQISQALYDRAKKRDFEVLGQGNGPLYVVPGSAEALKQFEMTMPDLPRLLALAGERGVETQDEWPMLFGDDASLVGRFNPAYPLSVGHTALAIAAGMVDGTEVEIDGQPFLIKGSSHKRVETSIETTEDEEGNEVTEQTDRERLVQQISALNLINGELRTYDSVDDQEAFGAFLTDHQEMFVEAVERDYPPRFDPGVDMAAWGEKLDTIRAPGKLPGVETSGLLPAQQERMAALTYLLRSGAKAAGLGGEMGTGKTSMSLGIMALTARKDERLVVVAPANTLDKWKRETEVVLAEFGTKAFIIGERRRQSDGQGKVRKIGRPVLDVEAAFEHDGPAVLIMSYETAKNAWPWEHAFVWRKKWVEVAEFDGRVRKIIMKVATCPTCGKVVHIGSTPPIPLVWGEKIGRTKLTCVECRQPMWQAVPFKYGGRVAIADLLNRKYAGRYMLILDEAHHAKGGDTDAGYAAADLISGARKVLAMTGTWYAGKASSIFYLMYRLFPWFRTLYDYNDVDLFVGHHGLREYVTKSTRYRRYHSAYGYSRENRSVRELPGTSPRMVTMLLEATAWIKLADMGIHLPPYEELRLPVSHNGEFEDGLSAIESVWEEACRLARDNRRSLFSQALHLKLGWIDNPVEETLLDDYGKAYEVPGILTDARTLPANPLDLEKLLPKDRALLKVIKAELDQNRGIGVFFSQVNKRDWMPRIYDLLANHGIYSEILRSSTCRTDEREAWYREFVKRCEARGQPPVLLANGSLVKEGLDLVELQTLVEAGIEYRINDLRQRDRRSWRLTQDRPVKVVFLYYESSWQESALRLIASKLKAARQVDGDLAAGLAAMNDDGGNLLDALMLAVSRRDWSGMEEYVPGETYREKPSNPGGLPPGEFRQVEVANGVAQLSLLGEV